MLSDPYSIASYVQLIKRSLLPVHVCFHESFRKSTENNNIIQEAASY